MSSSTLVVAQDQAEKTFTEIIFPLISHGVAKEGTKVAYIVGGQPGSGKSAFAQTLLSKNQDIVFINGDDLRVYHPEYVRFLKENDQEAADKTQVLCNFWIERSIEECVRRGLSFIVEGTMRTTSAPLLTAQKAVEHGYSVEGCVIAAPYALSLASIIYRYLETKRIEGSARFTKKESHDEAYRNIPNTLKTLIEGGYFSKMSIYERLDGEFITHSFGSQNMEEALSVLQAGRERPLSERELTFVKENEDLDGHTVPIV